MRFRLVEKQKEDVGSRRRNRGQGCHKPMRFTAHQPWPDPGEGILTELHGVPHFKTFLAPFWKVKLQLSKTTLFRVIN